MKAEDCCIIIDKGHGIDTAGKRTPEMHDGTIIHESEFNLPVSMKLFELAKSMGFNVYHVSPNEFDSSLSDRSGKANSIMWDVDKFGKANTILVSIHYNAYNGIFDSKSGGVETYHYPNSSKGSRLATAIHNEIIQGTDQYNRGVKDANFHMLRETYMPAALIEFGFMDKYSEASLMLDESYQDECANETLKGICKYFDVKYIKPDELDVESKLIKIRNDIDSLIEKL